jgi:biopolymer transport protein ExbB/TolQ
MLLSLASWFNGGGVFMWAILAVLAFAVAVVIERSIFYYIVCRRQGAKMVPAITTAVTGGKVADATTAIRGRAPVAIMFRTALDLFAGGMTSAEIQEGVEAAAIRQMPRLSERLNYLVLFANIATLTGLLGTIMGLQKAFSSLGAIEAAKKAAILASGISELMVCTAFGLMVAIPCMMAYTFLHNKQSRIAKDLDESVVKLMNFFKKRLPA